jgi:hypothetical protein
MLLVSPEFCPSSAAEEIQVAPELSFVALPFPNSDVFESHRLELRALQPEKHFAFGDNQTSALFAPPPTNLSEADWDHLWHNASRIPITSIPEPGSSSLVVGGAILLGLRRLRQLRG